jgi:hypothetical protein
MVNPTTNIDDLRALLEQLYPDIHISGTGVALLAAEIAELDDRCELVYAGADHHPARNVGAQMPGTRILLPLKIDRLAKYGTNNYTK